MVSVNDSHFSVAEAQPVFRAFLGLADPRQNSPGGGELLRSECGWAL